MPYFHYRDGLIVPPGNAVARLVDPDEVNRRFEDIARFLNGNLGLENIRPGRQFSPSTLSGSRDFFSVHFHCDSSIGTTWVGATVQLFRLLQSAVLVAVDIQNASYATGAEFAATLWNGANTICTLTDDASPARPFYTVQKMEGAYASLTAPKTISIKPTQGTFCGITLHFTAASLTP